MLLVVLYEMLCAARDVQAILRALVRAIWQQLHALVFAKLQMMLRARIACEFATDSTRGVASLHCCLRYCENDAGFYVASYTAFKKHALARCRTMPTV